jgi:sn-glycerol 3-phosphate transport system permease protein
MKDDRGQGSHWGRSKRVRRPLGVTKVLVLTLLAIVFLIPIIWMSLTSLKAPLEVFENPLGLLPRSFSFIENVKEVLTRAPFGHYYVNTFIITGGLAIIQLSLSIPAAYAFGCLQFKGRDVLFLIFLTRFLIVPAAVFLPNYLTVSQLHLVDTRLGVMLPYFASAMAVFLLRQAFRQIPRELIDAAKVDGASNLRFLWCIGVPLIKPAIFAFVIISLVYHWNEFFWPFLVGQTVHARTLSVGLGRLGLQSQSGAEWVLTMTASIIVSLPIMVAFVFFQRQFVRSFMRTGLK